jgi:hypothetical protein
MHGELAIDGSENGQAIDNIESLSRSFCRNLGHIVPSSCQFYWLRQFRMLAA